MLFKKAYRAMWAHKRSYLACIFLIMIGTMIFTAMGTAAAGLRAAMESFYSDYRLACVWANVRAVPISEVDRLRAVTGVSDVMHRSTMDVRAEIPGNDGIIILQMGSFVTGAAGRLNDLHITSGELPSARNDIMLSQMFHDYHGFEIGDLIRVFSQGRAFDFRVSGAFLSPEFIYLTRGGADLLPDHAGFGAAYVTEEAINTMGQPVSVANQLLFSLAYGYEFSDVQFALQDALRPYGLVTLHGRDGHFSYAMMDMYVPMIETMSRVMPFVFVAMAVVVLYLMLKRIIEQERTQIGTLKAMGYSNASMVLHYMAYGGITGLVGGLLGFFYGGALAGVYLGMFLEFFTMPELAQTVEPVYLIFCLVIGVGGGLLGAFMGALRALQLSPAEAMRPEAPKPVKFDIVGKIPGLRFILNSRGQMALRGIVRHPFRSAFTVVGVTFGFMVLTVFGDMQGMIDAMLYSQFEDIRLYNMRVTLTRPVRYEQAVEAAFAMPEVSQAEGLWELPVVLANGHLREGTFVTGVPSYSRLFSIFDTSRRVAHPPPEFGLIITNGIADSLNARAGDILYISTFLSEDEIAVPVARVIDQSVGSGAFMELRSLADLVSHPPVASALMIGTDNVAYVSDLFTESPLTATVESVDASLQAFIDMMEPFSFIYTAMYVMGIAIAFAIIYNTATISLSERQREYATLRVLGLSPDEVCEIMRFEYWVLAVIGMIFGIPLAGGLMTGLNAIMDTTMMSMPSILSTQAYIMAAVGCAVAIMLSNYSAKRRISKFDMVEVLKERE